MNKTITTLTLALAVSSLAVFAQNPTNPPAGEPKSERHWGGGKGGGPMHEILETLTPEERKQYREAHRKAMESPEVAQAKEKADAARKEAFADMKAALLKQDPSLASVLDKAQHPGDLRNLSPEDREKLHAARKAARPGPEALGKAAPAEKEFHDALRAAMLKADPNIGPILDKVDAAMKEKRAQRKGHGPGEGKNAPPQ